MQAQAIEPNEIRRLSAYELGGKRAAFPMGAMPVGAHVMCRDGLVIDLVPI